MDSVLEEHGHCYWARSSAVSILVSVDSVLEVSFLMDFTRYWRVSILVSVDSVLEGLGVLFFRVIFPRFNPSFCGFGIGG